jgi:hypothetical protein
MRKHSSNSALGLDVVLGIDAWGNVEGGWGTTPPPAFLMNVYNYQIGHAPDGLS